ncbi:MAG: aldo/keto reductase [Oscillospiraceae bacterium]|jgi:predicted aldo/keto reductase-like oxidoreductase|nr:aldo/keto reductase [Oscillospiraceae bacterium]
MKNYFGAPVKKLGFGFMRLPTLSGAPDADIDIEQVKQMVDLYMTRGFTYFDTAFVYHSGKSEVAIRQAVTERYPREKFQVTTKLPLWNPNVTQDEIKQTTQTSLDRAGLSYYDLYFLHGIGPGREEMLDKVKAWDYIQELKQQGKAKNIGFSYHGDADTLNKYLDAHAKDIDIIQLQINYLDWLSDDVQSKKCYDTAVSHGVGVIVMEPVKGGSLANFTPQVAEIFKRANPNASLASWALRFPMSLDGVVTVLSGMSDIEQVDDNTTTADTLGKLSDEEYKVIDAALEELKKIPVIPCTACRYCVDDCPKNINTPGIIGIINEYKKYQNIQGAKRSYGQMTGPSPFMPPNSPAPGKSGDCIECGSCENHCPQNIKIIDTHKEASKLFE